MNSNNARTFLYFSCMFLSSAVYSILSPASGDAEIVLIYSPIVKVYWTADFNIF